MKLTAIETIVFPEHPHCLFVQLHTDEGLVGLGETFPRPGAASRVIHDTLAPLILGEDPLAIERLWNRMFQAIHYHGFAGAEQRALSAIDIALWDLLGQASNQPIYRLLGGPVREEIPVYNTCVSHGSYRDHELYTENPEELAESLLEDGVRAMKIWPFDDLSTPTLGHRIDPETLRRGLEPFERIRKAVGDEMEIAFEGHCCWTLPAAKQIAKASEHLRLMWLEDLVSPEPSAVLAELRRSTNTPICGSERLFHSRRFLDLLQAEAVDIVMPDIAWVGGFTEMQKIAHLADVYQRPIAPHNCGGPVINLANAHISAAATNLYRCESVRAFYRTFFEKLVTNPIEVKKGQMQLPKGPGLGAKLNPDQLKRTDLKRERSEYQGVFARHWADGDPWKDGLGDQF